MKPRHFSRNESGQRRQFAPELREARVSDRFYGACPCSRLCEGDRRSQRAEGEPTFRNAVLPQCGIVSLS